MNDFHSAMLVCSGWLASILVGVTIDLWRVRRRQRRGERQPRLGWKGAVRQQFGNPAPGPFSTADAAELAINCSQQEVS